MFAAARPRHVVASSRSCNSVGGQDELIFDGHSVVLDDEGEVLARAPGFEEALLVVDLDPTAAIGRRLRDVAPARARARAGRACRRSTVIDSRELRTDHRRRLSLRKRRAARATTSSRCGSRSSSALRDYVEKNGFRDVVVGALGRDRLGADRGARRRGARRRSACTASRCRRGSRRRARAATRSGSPRASGSTSARSRSRRSSPPSSGALAPSFGGREPDLTEENLQARVRGVLLMALSNKFGWLVVATGNKSELSVGYATLYGDMAGGFALLKDVFKTDVFRLARHLNERAGRELIPQSIIERAPSAELRADQLDEDSLPPYAELDRVLEAYVELDRSREELLADGFDPDVVDRALAMIDRAEYKRRQAPPGVKLRPKAFGRDRRTPITNRWRG